MKGPNALDKMGPLRRSLDDLDLRLQIAKKQEVVQSAGDILVEIPSHRAITKIVEGGSRGSDCV